MLFKEHPDVPGEPEPARPCVAEGSLPRRTVPIAAAGGRRLQESNFSGEEIKTVS